jgi:hypothetical protein
MELNGRVLREKPLYVKESDGWRTVAPSYRCALTLPEEFTLKASVEVWMNIAEVLMKITTVRVGPKDRQRCIRKLKREIRVCQTDVQVKQ